MHNYQEMKIWQKAVELSVSIYRLTDSFPKSERYNLIIQMRKSAVSIASNIAEGSGRASNKDFERFLGIALGSSFELQTQVIISSKLTLLTEAEFEKLNENIEELKKMIWGFKKSISVGKPNLVS